MPEKAFELVRRVSAARGETISSFVRRAILRELAGLSYLTSDEKKALGLRAPDINHTGGEKNEDK